MAEKIPAPASTLRLAGAEITAGNGLTFAFTCETLSDGTARTIYANVRITNGGEVNVRDYEVWRGQVPRMDRQPPMLFSDNNGMDENTLEGYCLADFVSRAQ